VKRVIFVFGLLCTVGLAGFADEYSSSCQENQGQMTCREPAATAVNNNNLNNLNNINSMQQMQNQQAQMAAYQQPQVYQPAYNPAVQNMQTAQPAYTSYAPSAGDFEQSRVAVAAVNQMNIAPGPGPQPDFSVYAPISGVDGLREQSQKIRDAAQDNTQNITHAYAGDDDPTEQSRSAAAAVDQRQFSQPVAPPPDFSAYANISGVDGLRDQSQKIKDASQDSSISQ